ncbi:Uncharacterised protein [uncultured archaeon]|nr:Uncharacterised protein [uncultured archaeon]
MDYLFEVRTIEDLDGLPKGSHIYVEKELKKDYEGLFSFRGATVVVTVPKNKCIKLDDLHPDPSDSLTKLIVSKMRAQDYSI